MILYPNAKINIGLKVIRKRPDGFHDIETIFYPVRHPVDILEIVESDKVSVHEYGLDFPGKPEDNICLKAYQLLKRDFNLPPVAIYLHKNIPVGAGMGGGSSDASHTIIALDKMFGLNLTHDQKIQYASALGSDCPFFIINKPMLGKGRGEILSPVEIPDLSGYVIKLLFPPYFVSTAQAYKGIISREQKESEGVEFADTEPLSKLVQLPVEKWKDFISNDFETTVFAHIPQLKRYKEELYSQGALYASMSGSGSSMFGIFKK